MPQPRGKKKMLRQKGKARKMKGKRPRKTRAENCLSNNFSQANRELTLGMWYADKAAK